jgi:hypothetical protein
MAEITSTSPAEYSSWDPLPKISFDDEQSTVTVTHQPYPIREYAEVRAGQLCALLSLMAGADRVRDGSYETAFGLARQLADEVSALTEILTRGALPEVSNA